MEYFKISGGKKLSGQISVHGAKNSALPILASTLLIKGESVIHNCPDLSDVRVTLDILKSLGCKVKREKSTVLVDASVVNKNEISEHTMRTMRSSIIFLSALLSRKGSASIFYPGGCEIGTRPIDLHLKAFHDLGANVSVNGSSINACATSIIGTKIILPFPSVGTTENIIIASAISKGKTIIVNPAREPEISDLADFLNHCGAKIYGAGESTIVIDGVKNLLGIHSPSKVFAGIGGFMAEGLGDGFGEKFASIKKDIEGSMTFDAAEIGFSASAPIGELPGTSSARGSDRSIHLTVVSPSGKELARFVAPYMGAQLQLVRG